LRTGFITSTRVYPVYPDWLERLLEPFSNNANATVRLSAWKVHPYDETLTGLEDLAWAKWALGEGCPMVATPHCPRLSLFDIMYACKVYHD